MCAVRGAGFLQEPTTIPGSGGDASPMPVLLLARALDLAEYVAVWSRSPLEESVSGIRQPKPRVTPLLLAVRDAQSRRSSTSFIAGPYSGSRVWDHGLQAALCSVATEAHRDGVSRLPRSLTFRRLTKRQLQLPRLLSSTQTPCLTLQDGNFGPRNSRRRAPPADTAKIISIRTVRRPSVVLCRKTATMWECRRKFLACEWSWKRGGFQAWKGFGCVVRVTVTRVAVFAGLWLCARRVSAQSGGVIAICLIVARYASAADHIAYKHIIDMEMVEGHLS